MLNKIVILRPGALGDVLAVRGVIRFFRQYAPDVEICLAAPGARGALFRRDGWADRVHDWERTAFSWLFSEGESPPAPALQAVFAGADLVVSYVDTPTPEDALRLRNRLAWLAPRAGAVFCPSRPPPGHEEAIGEWLARAAVAFCLRYGLVPPGTAVDLEAVASARITVRSDADSPVSPGRAYAVLHPGSGGARKNWPLEQYVKLGRALMASTAGGGCACGCCGGLRMVVTSGEADADLGERLVAAVPGAVHVYQPDLETLAGILAGARLYVGNDSGVTHLAAAVAGPGGGHPQVVAVFGASDPAVWAPPGALVLHAGADMQGLSAKAALHAILSATAAAHRHENTRM